MAAKHNVPILSLVILLFSLVTSITGVHAKSIELLTGLAKPPFIIGDQGQGMQLDIIRAAFAHADIKVKFLHLPLARNIKGFQQWNADGVITLPSQLHPEGMFISAPYIVYQNVAVSLADSNFVIENLTDLAGKKIAAFQNAKKFLGPVYAQATNADISTYSEFADQSKQISSLFSRQTEVIVLDESIFKYFIHEHKQQKMYQKPFNIHYIFNQRNYSAGFDTKENRDAFDLGIQKIKASGQYQQILDSYLL